MIAVPSPAATRPPQPVLPALAVFFCLTFVALSIAAIAYTRLGQTPEVHFTPGDPATTEVIEELTAARATVRVQAYSFTSAPIAKALVDAHRRGVEVTAILDKSNKTAQYSSADFLAHAGVPTYLDGKHAIAHNKIMIIDGQTVITGSFNFTKAAEKNNAENLLVVRDVQIANEYEENWQTHLRHAEPYRGK